MTGDLKSLAALAAEQGGVLLTGQAVGRGWSQRALNRCLGRDGWRLIHAGAWAEPGREVDGVLRMWAIQLRHPQLVASHRAAAALHDVEVLVDRMEFIGPVGGRSAVHGGTVHRLPLAEAEVEAVAGLRVTTVPRTLADLLRGAPRDEALAAVESAVSRRRSRACPDVQRSAVTTLAEIATALDRAPGIYGTRGARAALALADVQAGSPAETIARLRMHEAGLRPSTQVTLLTPGGRRVRPDFLFLRHGLVVEIEGYRWHGSRAAHRQDVLRFNELQCCPQVRRVLRFTADDVFHESGRIIREIRNALDALGARSRASA